MAAVGLFIGVVAVLVVMNLFFFIIFRGITIRLGKFAQINVLRQAGVMDELIQKKEQTLQEMQRQLEETRAPDNEAFGKPQAGGASAAPDFMRLTRGEYRDPSFIEEYREIRDNFVFDHGECVAQVLKDMPKNDEAGPAREILDTITLDASYNLSTLEAAEQLQVLREVFGPRQRALLDEYCGLFGEERFECYEFVAWLKQVVFEKGGQVVVRTSRPGEDFGSLDNRVETQYDNTICEGMYVVAQGTLYDFAIRNREIIG